METRSDLDELINAVRERPRSAALLRALLAEAVRGVVPGGVVELLAELHPEWFEDRDLRRSVADYLLRAGRDEAARHWLPAPPDPKAVQGASVVNLFARTSPVRPEPVSRLTFADVGGLEEAKRQIHRRVLAPIQRPSLFRRFARRAGGGVLLYGPPGCGKTLLARATAGEAGVAFIPVEIADVLDNRVGHSEKRLVAAFAEARSRAPSVLFFDELEALASRRHHEARDHKSSLVSAFLGTFDALREADEGVLVLAATNVPWSVDSAFRRPGRFDRTVFVAPPDRTARAAILQRLLAGRPTDRDLDVRRVVEATGGFSGADLLHLVETAVDLAIEEDMSGTETMSLTRRHFDEALGEVKPTTLEWLATARNYAKYANEAGLYDDVLTFLDRHAR